MLEFITGLGVTKLIVTFILSGIIGFNRGSANQGAGLRTHILVGLGACLSVIVSFKTAATFNSDPYRLSAQVISGIGFLGAGTIIKTGQTVKGLTTAASLWVIAIVGICVGSGYYILAIFTTVLIVISLSLIKKINAFSTSKYVYKTILVKFKYSNTNKKEIDTFLRTCGICAKNEKIIYQRKVDNEVFALLKIECFPEKENTSIEDVINELILIDSVIKVDFQSELEKLDY